MAKTKLAEVTVKQTVGFADAVRDLGTHKACGKYVNYTTKQVREVLKGKRESLILVKRIREKRPDLLTLSWVCKELRTAK